MKAFLLLAVTLLFCIGIVHADGITVSNFDGAWHNDIKVTTGEPVTWTLHWNSMTNGVVSFTNGFRVFISSDGSPAGLLDPGPGFTPITFQKLYFFYDCPVFVSKPFGIDGFGADTIGFAALDCWGGIYIDADVWTITTQVEDNTEGRFLCIDSTYFPPGGSWTWAGADWQFAPSWDGPHCYFIQHEEPEEPEVPEGISVSNIDGAWDNDTKISPGQPVTWTFRVDTPPEGIYAFTNGFKVFISSDETVENLLNPGPGFTPITYTTITNPHQAGFDHYYQVPFSIDGNGADTVGFYGKTGFKNAQIYININEDMWEISTQVEDNAIGNYLCIDSTFFPPGGAWLWTSDQIGTIIPSWDGPHCYLIEPCCQGIRGDVTGAEGILIDDLMYLRDFLFVGGPSPDCLKKGDVVIDGDILVNDLVFLVDYLFKGGEAPPQCD